MTTTTETASPVRTTKYLSFEVIPNGGLRSVIDNSGRIWATGHGDGYLLADTARAARAEGYTHLTTGDRVWDIDFAWPELAK